MFLPDIRSDSSKMSQIKPNDKKEAEKMQRMSSLSMRSRYFSYQIAIKFNETKTCSKNKHHSNICVLNAILFWIHRHSSSSPTPTARIDSRNCAANVTETTVFRTRSSPCFSSSSKTSSKYSMSNQSSTSKANTKVWSIKFSIQFLHLNVNYYTDGFWVQFYSSKMFWRFI